MYIYIYIYIYLYIHKKATSDNAKVFIRILVNFLTFSVVLLI